MANMVSEYVVHTLQRKTNKLEQEKKLMYCYGITVILEPCLMGFCFAVERHTFTKVEFALSTSPFPGVVTLLHQCISRQAKCTLFGKKKNREINQVLRFDNLGFVSEEPGFSLINQFFFYLSISDYSRFI